MKTHTHCSALVLASAAVWFGACAGVGAQQRTTGEAIDDGALTARVKAALIDNEQTKARQIDVETYRGEVQLNGFVDSKAAKEAAASVARGVSGVTTVKNNLQVGAERTAGEFVDDATITAKVKTALIGDSRTEANQIEVTTHDGVVQLGGFVDSANDKAVATELASAVKGVASVSNKLEVRNN